MYGMVNKSVEEMVVAAHGEARWREIKRRAGVTEELFISNEGYPDEITYKLVGAASELLGVSPVDILRGFGEHWVLHTARHGYGHLLQAGGQTLGEFLVNLPQFHDRIVLLYPKLQPPRFVVTDVTPRSVHLHYHSTRLGLTNFVEGLISGLGKLYQTPTRCTVQQSRAEGADHDVFLIEW